MIQCQGLSNELSDVTRTVRRAVWQRKAEHLQTGLCTIHMKSFSLTLDKDLSIFKVLPVWNLSEVSLICCPL